MYQAQAVDAIVSTLVLDLEGLDLSNSLHGDIPAVLSERDRDLFQSIGESSNSVLINSTDL